MTDTASEYDSYVEHSRFGRVPRITGLNPTEDPEHGLLFWIIPPESKIPNTAVPANTDRQKITSFPIPFYFDQKRTCRDCNRPFIWFAEEQKYWFEELGFNLNADCVRCVECRQKLQGKAAKRPNKDG